MEYINSVYSPVILIAILRSVLDRRMQRISNNKQEWIPVACVPAIALATTRCHYQGSASRGVCLWGALLPGGLLSKGSSPGGGGMPPGGMPKPPPPTLVDRMTDRHFWKRYLPLRSVKISSLLSPAWYHVRTDLIDQLEKKSQKNPWFCFGFIDSCPRTVNTCMCVKYLFNDTFSLQTDL